MIIINSLQWMVQKELVKIYGNVIMPNPIHLMWEQLAMNGKEFPKNSFEKFTAKTLVANMKARNDGALKNYAVKAPDREQNIWLRDFLAIKIFKKKWLHKSWTTFTLTRCSHIGCYAPTPQINVFHQQYFTNKM